MHRNIPLIYLLTFVSNVWLWLGIWIFFYLQFTTYAGIGLLESVMIITIILTEVPSGALADLVGKKITLVIAFVLIAIGNFIMGFATGFEHLVVAVFITSIGFAFTSGSVEALLFESLKKVGRENEYDAIFAHTQSISLAAFALSAGIGGFMYTMSPSLPFFVTGSFVVVAAIIALFLQEIHQPKQSPTWHAFFRQQFAGFTELTTQPYFKKYIWGILGIAFFLLITNEILNDAILVEVGFEPKQLGMVVAVATLFAAAAVQLTPSIRKYLRLEYLGVTCGLFVALSLLISPFVGLLIAGMAYILRVGIEEMFSNVTSVMINEHTNSDNRATTLSTFNLLKRLPYAGIAFTIGYSMDLISATQFAFYMGGVLFLISLISLILFRPTSKSR